MNASPRQKSGLAFLYPHSSSRREGCYLHILITVDKRSGTYAADEYIQEYDGYPEDYLNGCCKTHTTLLVTH